MEYVSTELQVPEGPGDMLQQSAWYPAMCLLPASVLPSLMTIVSWEIPSEQFAKEVKSQIWFIDRSASFAGM